MRLFVAINIPHKIKEEIGKKLISKIPPDKFKPVPQKNLHLTLCFLGERDEKELGAIKEKINTINFHDFPITLEGTGHFWQRVVWVWIAEGAKELSELAARICEVLEIRSEKFSAHLTIARARENISGAERIAENLRNEKFRATFNAEKICLMQSRLSPAGPAYFELYCKTFSKRESES